MGSAGSGLLLCLGGAPGAAETFPEPKVAYAADVAMQVTSKGVPGGSFQSTGRIWFADGKTRRAMQIMGRERVVIERPDRGVRWMLVPEMSGGAIESPIGGSTRGEPDPGSVWREDVTLEKQGREQVNGVEADRYAVTMKNGRGTAWLTAQNVPVRYEGTFTENGETGTLRMDHTNLQIGPQEASLFELPEGVSPMRTPPLSHPRPGRRPRGRHGASPPAGRGDAQADGSLARSRSSLR